MTGQLSISPAERRDAAELAVLIDVASHGFASWLWYGAVMKGTVDTAFERGRAKMREDEPGAWRSGVLAEWDGEVAGMSIAYDLDESVRDSVAQHPVIEPLLVLQRTVVGNRFIDSLGVYKHHRGKGIGRALLEWEFAAANGRPVSLITESYNETALSLYRRNGFAEVERVDAVPLSENSKRHAWVLLTRNVS